MRILTVADVDAPYYYDYYLPGKLKGFDFILACGDLHREFLEFLVTMANCPLFYVHGNHDEGYDKNPPEGCVCIDDEIVECKGIRILGLGGSYRYRDGKYMYTEQQMCRRIRKLKHRLKKTGGFDILVTHAPARHINDEDTLSHRGFECFLNLMETYHPKYFVHGHTHLNYSFTTPQESVQGDTIVVNAYDHVVIDYPAENIK